jgi:hypothetical protein
MEAGILRWEKFCSRLCRLLRIRLGRQARHQDRRPARMEFPEATDRGFSAVQCGGADAFHGLWRSGIALASGLSGVTW